MAGSVLKHFNRARMDSSAPAGAVPDDQRARAVVSWSCWRGRVEYASDTDEIRPDGDGHHEDAQPLLAVIRNLSARSDRLGPSAELSAPRVQYQDRRRRSSSAPDSLATLRSARCPHISEERSAAQQYAGAEGAFPTPRPAECHRRATRITRHTCISHLIGPVA